MKTITCINLKGGTGKTSSVAIIGHLMATEKHLKVLLVDDDPQGNLTALFKAEHNIVERFSSCIQGRLIQEHPTMTQVYDDPSIDPMKVIRPSRYPGLDYIAADLSLARGEELLKADVSTPQQFRLKTLLDNVRNNYDVCLIDCSPSLSLLNVNALVASDYVYVPTRPDDGSLEGVAMTYNLVKEVQTYSLGLKMGGIFFTAYNSKEAAYREAEKLLGHFLPSALMPQHIGVTTFIKKMGMEQKMLAELSPKHRVTREYRELTDTMLQA